MTLRDLCRPLGVGSPVGGGFRLAAIHEQRASVVLRKEERLLAVRIDARDDAAPSYRTTPSFNVVYLGRPGRALARDEHEALHALCARLRRNDRGEPLGDRAPSRVVRMARGLRDEAERPDEVTLTVRADDPEAIFVDVEAAARMRARRLVLRGEEPLDHPRVLEAIAVARRSGIDEVLVVTGGARLADPGFVARALRHGRTRFRLRAASANRGEVEAAARTLQALGVAFEVEEEAQG